MHLILRYMNGQRADALLLSSGNGVMRVVVRGKNETLEFKLASQLWTGEDGERVCIEAIMEGPNYGALQPNTMNSTTAETANTLTAAKYSTAAGEMN